MFLQYNEIFLEISEIDVHHGAVWVNYGLGQHIITRVGVVNVTDFLVIVHALLVLGLLTTLVTQKHNAAPVPPVLLFTGNSGKHLVAGWLTGAQDGVELRVPVDAQS